MEMMCNFHQAALLLLAIVFFTLSPPLKAEQMPQSDNNQVIQAFTSQEESAVEPVEDQTKRLVMFIMGVPLLLLLLITGGLGIAMGVYGKPVFVAHMICAGLTMTLAVAHAIVGVVWFYPF